MSLNTDPYGINLIPDINTPSPVEVTLDGKFLGEALSVEVTRSYDSATSVNLKNLVGIADVSFYGHVYRDLRKANKELEKKVHLANQVADSRGEVTAYWSNAYEVAAKKATERYMEIIRLKDELQAKAEPIDTLQLRYDVRVRDEQIAELKAEVERLFQSRKEQAEKHNRKQANLQANFEQNAAGQEKARFLKKENSSLKRENALKQERNRELVAELQKLKANGDQSERLAQAETAIDNLAGKNVKLADRVKFEKASSAFWHEKFLGAQEVIESQGDRIEDLVRGSNSLVESINGVSMIVDEAAEYWNEKVED